MMEEVKAQATLDEVNEETGEKTKRDVVVDYDFGNDLDDAVEKFSAAVVFNLFVKQARVALQGVLRRLAQDGLSDEDIAKRAAAWQPGMSLSTDPMTKMSSMFNGLDPEQQKELLALLEQRV